MARSSAEENVPNLCINRVVRDEWLNSFLVHLVAGDEEASSSQFLGYVLVEEGDDVFVSSIFHLVNKFYDVGRAV